MKKFFKKVKEAFTGKDAPTTEPQEFDPYNKIEEEQAEIAEEPVAEVQSSPISEATVPCGIFYLKTGSMFPYTWLEKTGWSRWFT